LPRPTSSATRKRRAGFVVEVEPLEDVLDGGALEVLQRTEDGVDVEGGGVVGHS